MSGETKLELLGLVDEAVAGGWAYARACQALELADVRVHRWRARLAEAGTLEDRPPVGNAVHRILPCEEQAILNLIEQFSGQLSAFALLRLGFRDGVWTHRPSRRVCRCHTLTTYEK